MKKPTKRPATLADYYTTPAAIHAFPEAHGVDCEALLDARRRGVREARAPHPPTDPALRRAYWRGVEAARKED